jgi:hypothetical protein
MIELLMRPFYRTRLYRDGGDLVFALEPRWSWVPTVPSAVRVAFDQVPALPPQR